MKNLLQQKIREAIKKAYLQKDIPDFGIDYADEKFGDFSTNIAMILSKQVGESPKEVAQKIIDQINDSKTNDIIETAEIAGPGFINLKIQIPYLNQKISEIIEAGDKYASSDLGKDLKVNIEFISANPTGPLTLGNGRNAYAGDCLANVFTKYGAEVEREYYINDRGVQVLALGHSVLKDEEAVYKGAYIDEVASKIKSKDPKEVGEEAAIIIAEEYIKKTIRKMDIDFDHWFSEKAMFDKGEVTEMISHLQKTSLTYQQDGALWLKTTDFGDDKDRVLITGKGEHTYFASDIAYHHDKIKRGYDLLIDFWGADHHGYIARMKAAVEVVRQEENWNGKLDILICQLVRLMSEGKEVKMSKRAGTYVTLDELIDEVGPDVTRFFFLDRSLNTHMDFDLDLAKEKSQKNPVFYVQYAHARINSILAKSEIQTSQSKIDEGLLKEPEEIALIKELLKLPEIIDEIVGDYQVQKLTFYARQIAEKFHHFYEKCPVINADDPNIRAARVQLLLATKIVLKNTLDLMGISAPEKM